MTHTFIACLGTETNSFSSLPTGLETFQETMLCRCGTPLDEEALFATPLRYWRQMIEAAGDTVSIGLAAFAQPGGITAAPVYRALRDELLADLRAAGPVERVMLFMHGAMIADGCDDCEGDVLERVRAIVGPGTVIGVLLDLHCSVTEQMVVHADIIVTYKEYPHVDVTERAREVYTLCHRAARREIRPVMAVVDCRMVSMWYTTTEPMMGIVRAMQAEEGRGRTLSVSFAHGFPWSDVPDTSAKLLVVADSDQASAKAVARQIARRIWEVREDTLPQPVAIEVALDAVEAATSAPLVLADVSDNPGGGAPSDSTFILRAMIARGMRDIVSGYYWDPTAVRLCAEAGEGARLALRVGGKCGPTSGDPIDLEVTVVRVLEEATQAFGTSSRRRLGMAALVRSASGIELVLTSLRVQVLHPDGFEQFGIRLAERRAVVVKSTQHFYAGFCEIAAEVLYVDAPGATRQEFSSIPYRKYLAPYWPKITDPFSNIPTSREA
ncbi:M81 family metallopeptidase [Roseovarius aestuarii]|uniref:Microcystinase C n=1 Tax=Roseovarius aestuarii TaxID=475083 RepID=A0A1X7BWI1_9RHOB|nr:M81 family metallopeptidase [Roseovarius aestuarii]SMC14001.1 hypothetical protein ROA7745_03863 [Roseovarius aestuarii]